MSWATTPLKAMVEKCRAVPPKDEVWAGTGQNSKMTLSIHH